MRLLRTAAAATAFLLAPVAPAASLEAAKTFIYVLHVAPGRQDPKSWTEADKRAVSDHFNRLKAGAETGQVILAGRTQEPLNQTFGIVIFEAADPAAADRYLREDPAVKAGVMTAEVHPYEVAVHR